METKNKKLCQEWNYEKNINITPKDITEFSLKKVWWKCNENDGDASKIFPVDLWQRYASPVWMDINPSRTLQYRCARDNNDERHICPLQLDVIERAVELWSAKDDVVFSPFTGIGSEGYTALKMGRKFIGSELKESYYNIAKNNLEAALLENNDQLNLFETECENDNI